MSHQVNWSLLALLRIVLATIVAGAHLVWLRKDEISLGLEIFGGKAAVVGFLLVSGFSIAASLDRDGTGFYFRRFKRIYPMYFFCVAAAIALEMWLGTYDLPMYTLEARGWTTAIGNLLMLQMTLVKSVAFNGVVWSLAVEAAFYAISPLLKRCSVPIVLAMIAVSAAFYMLPATFDGGMVYSLALKANAVKYFWPFGMGFLAYYHRSNLVTVSFLLFGSALVGFSGINYEKFSVVTFAGSFLLLILARDGPAWQSKPADYLGDISYPVYLVQIPVFVICYRLFDVTSPVLLLLAMFLTAAIAYDLIDVRFKRATFGRAKSFHDLFRFGQKITPPSPAT